MWDSPGGGTKGALYAAIFSKCIQSGLKPDVVVTASVSSIIWIGLALGIYDPQWIEITLRRTAAIKIKDFFDVPPVNKKGKLTFWAVLRALTGKESLGVQNVSKVLESVIGEVIFEYYRDDERLPDILVCAYDYHARSMKYWNLKKLTWKQANLVIAASCALPVNTEGVWIDGRLYYDAGVVSQNPLVEIPGLIKMSREVVSVIPKNMNLHKIKDPNNILDVLSWFIDTRTMHSSKNDELQLDELCEDAGIKPLKLYAQYEDINPYFTDPAKLKQQQQKNMDAAEPRIKAHIKEQYSE